MKQIQIITLFFLCCFLTSCMTTAATYGYLERSISPKATKEQQQQVKQQVMQLLEKEYKQPFKLESFEYKYQTHNRPGSFDFAEYGTYYFKIEAVDNPVIVMNFRIDDMKKSSTNELIEGFKNKKLKDLYCGSLESYYLNLETEISQPYANEAEKYCDSRDQAYYKVPKERYLQYFNLK
ncbi:hypothetical protein EDC55_10185 [Allofrancisella inopinata]|uniref:Lipoprotein n=1 Tax=Allofrancisella inopinata TaxID=1085647 RepID=A0AAE6YK46_9GAMM|nr:hypothetical protein [Allofrancisella inopinata]QIV96267.1 hypothetical protein E4K63_05245 [Allofrancisella inopinata]TDT74540.1 hypothetical protein EDC55_10185 [Allofrancisella inopinata]